MMKILLYSINFSPEKIGIGKYNGELVEWLSDRDCQIDVITTFPYYPEWQIDKEYKNKWLFVEEKNNIRIKRSKIYVPNKVTSLKRILHELSFFIMSFPFWIASFFKKYDVILSVAPPMLIGLYPSLYKIFRSTTHVYHIQDLQIDAAKELGMLDNSLLLNILSKIEATILQNADIVSSISKGMKERIFKKIDFSNKKYLPFNNWVDTDFIKPIPCDYNLKSNISTLINSKDFIVLYSGNIGEKQGFEVLIEVATLFDECGIKNIKFLICGDGVAKVRIERYVKEKKIENVIFESLQPYSQLPNLMSIADVHLVLQKKGAAENVMPSKLTTILAAGGLAIVTAEEKTTLYDIITNNKMGICIQPDDAKELSDTILKLYKEKEGFIYLKNNARKYALEFLSKEIILNSFLDTIKNK